jgi:hypothetical protein
VKDTDNKVENEISNKNQITIHSTMERGKNQRISRAQFLIFLDMFVKLKLNERKNEKENENGTGRRNTVENADKKSSNLSIENLGDSSSRCFKEYSLLVGLDVTNYQSVYFSRLAGAIIRDSGNSKNHSAQERNNFNVFLNSESGSGSGSKSGLSDNGVKNVKNYGENNNEVNSKNERGCENRVKPFPSFSEGIKVLEFFSGIGQANSFLRNINIYIFFFLDITHIQKLVLILSILITFFPLSFFFIFIPHWSFDCSYFHYHQTLVLEFYIYYYKSHSTYPLTTP